MLPAQERSQKTGGFKKKPDIGTHRHPVRSNLDCTGQKPNPKCPHGFFEKRHTLSGSVSGTKIVKDA
jgi:hypothetical protein